MSRSFKARLDRWIGERKYGIYAGLMIASAIVMIGSQGKTSMNTVNVADGYYPNCTAARDAGVTPIMRDEPGYRTELDRDNDGVACEPWQSSENTHSQ
jgi:hypothetical protein